MTWLMWAEFLHYLVTIVGLPFTIVFFALQQQHARRNEEQAIYQSLLDQYAHFMELVLEHDDLHLLRSPAPDYMLTAEQHERKFILFDLLTTLFERAFVLIQPAPRMNARTQQLWSPWEQQIRSWCRRDDFQRALPQLLEATDERFKAYMVAVAARYALPSSPAVVSNLAPQQTPE
jgi:hypothetical protein